MTNDSGAKGPGPAGEPGGAPRGHEHDPPPPGASFMNSVRWILFAGLLALAVASVTVYIVGLRSGGEETAATKSVRYYCPMHPSYTSDRPGECPICGMTLEPMPAAGEAHEGHAEGDGAAAVPGLAPIQISPERIQLIGLRTARAERRTMGGRLDLVGFVSPDEGSLRRVQIRVGGYIQKLYVNETGQTVRQGAPLLTLYSPELYQTELEYLIELGAHPAGDSSAEPPATGGTTEGHDGEGPGPHEGSALAAGRERLKLFGVPEEEIERLEREQTASTSLTLRAPVTGTVLERNVVDGQSVGAGTPLFTMADLAQVWVVADLYEMDYGRVRVGDRAEFRVDAFPGRHFDGRVDFLYPTVSSDTRTLKIRFALPNPGGVLRPGMYGRAAVYAGSRAVLAVPAEAVVNAGEHSYAFLARAGGRFEPRLVTAGRGDGEWVPILSGLAEGDTVVASASFLIDSESRLRQAISGLGSKPGAGHEHGATP